MGILAKILAGELDNEKISSSENHSEKNNNFSGPPLAPCPTGHLDFWCDAYGLWHCGRCSPPALEAMARLWASPTLPRDADASESDVAEIDSTNKLWNPSPNFRIIAIQHPDKTVDFSPTATQTEKKEAIESFQWWDRIDARQECIAEKEPIHG